jgi:hypothetical protein
MQHDLVTVNVSHQLADPSDLQRAAYHMQAKGIDSALLFDAVAKFKAQTSSYSNVPLNHDSCYWFAPNDMGVPTRTLVVRIQNAIKY